MFGILLVQKSLGYTSHDAVNRVRQIFKTRRVGHAGTLDPQASGLLVVAVGPATRFLQYLPLEPKEYVARIQFGITTDSYDSEGAILEERPVPSDIKTAFLEVRPKFMNLIEQVPPMYSAVKVAGKPLYKYARQGEVFERKPRTVHIEALDLLSEGDTWLEVRVLCSGGTYIRSLAFDLGEAIGCGAHLASLVRERVGSFHLVDAHTLEDANPTSLIPLREALAPMPMLALDERQLTGARDGRHLVIAEPPEGPYAGLLDETGQVFGVARVHGNVLQPECVIPKDMMNGGT